MPSPLVPDPVPDVLVENATCLACGCLCDDLTLTVRSGRVVEARQACELGRRWFLADHVQAGNEPATVEGLPATSETALDRAAAILIRARAPIVLGLTRTTTETVAEALALADRIGAVVDLDLSGSATARMLAFQRVGRVSATLGEVKNRADLVVFWGADPIVTHPRHWERYSVEPRGRFVPRGRDDRTVIVVDSQPTATAERADLFLQVAPDARFATLWTIRALLRGNSLDARQVERATGLTLEQLRDLTARLRQARYGAWFLDPACDHALVEAAYTLVRDLNTYTRFVILSLGGPGNLSGAEAVLTWQTGHPGRLDFREGAPRYDPSGNAATTLLEQAAADAALIVADDVEPCLSEAARAHLSGIPRIVIAPRATATARAATVALASATCGIDEAGTVMRCDGVMLPLRPPLESSLPTAGQWLQALRERVSRAQLEG